MTESPTPAADVRILILPPTPRDRITTREIFADAEFPVVLCESFEELVDEVRRGAGAVLFPEEALESGFELFIAALDEQGPWSDLPVLLLTRAGASSAAAEEATRRLGNVTLLERPIRVSSMISAVHSALRARERQYQIRDHLDERRQALEVLRDADRRKNEFLATLGHELRNPLAPLLSSLQLVKMLDLDHPALASALVVMQRQLDHLVRLVNDLLEVSRITRGVIEIRREVVDLREVLAAAVESVAASVEAAGHVLAIETPEEPIWVDGDAVRLTQVFSNLLNNAVKYTDQRGRISLRAAPEANQVVVEVRDQGIGIAAENLTSIFEMFSQVDRRDRRTQGGLGIGLTLASSLVAQHGGSISASSPGVGRGSSFAVRLPTTGAPPAATPHERSPAATLAGRDVLVVDDNRDAAEAITVLLRTSGARVRTAFSGREALAKFAERRPGVVLLDIGMPAMDGYEVARRMRQLEGGDAVLLVALSGWGQATDVARSESAGFDRHLVKPVDVDRLREVIALSPAGTRAT